jgi:hypothetical protein
LYPAPPPVTAPAFTDCTEVVKVRLTVAPVAFGLVASTTLTGLVGAAVYSPDWTTATPVMAPAVTEVTVSCAALENVPPATLRTSPTA